MTGPPAPPPPQSPWKIIRNVPPSAIDSSIEGLVSTGEGAGIAVASVEPNGRRSGPGTLMVHLVLKPRRSSGLDRLPSVGAFAVAHGIRKSTGVVAWIRPPGQTIIENRVVGNAFSTVKRVGSGSIRYVLLGLRVNCAIKSEQLGDLLSESPWPKNTLYMDPDMLLEKILESFDWIYSEWERGMDRTLESRIRHPVSGRPSFFP